MYPRKSHGADIWSAIAVSYNQNASTQSTESERTGQDKDIGPHWAFPDLPDRTKTRDGQNEATLR